MRATVEIEDVLVKIDGVPLNEWLDRQRETQAKQDVSDAYDQMRREREIVEAAYQDYLDEIAKGKSGIPHCDDLVLHAPGDCEYCDEYENRQGLRILHGIAFTGQALASDGGPWYAARPCPATLLRSVEKIDRWYGNVAKP